jgi:hypothetical protein
MCVLLREIKNKRITGIRSDCHSLKDYGGGVPENGAVRVSFSGLLMI